MNLDPEWIGAIASFLTTVSFFPQAWKVIKERNTQGISLLMYVMFTVGVIFWLAYGLMIGSMPVIIGNMIVVPLAAMILVMKIRLG